MIYLYSYIAVCLVIAAIYSTKRDPKSLKDFAKRFAGIFFSAPVLIPLFCLAGLSVPLTWWFHTKQRRRERALKLLLAKSGRTMAWAEVENRLQRGEGTLIVEHLSMKGPVREWWTEDDIGAGVPFLPKGNLQQIPNEELNLIKAFAKDCADKYVDLESGKGKMTSVPVPEEKKNDPRKYVTIKLSQNSATAIFLPTGRKLKQRFPNAKVVTLVRWQTPPFIGMGDAENFFLNSDEPKLAG